MAESQTYQIPDVELIPQTKTMACWYASATMLIKWRSDRLQMCEKAHPSPSDVPALQAQFLSNDGLPTRRILELAKSLGLEDVPPMTPSPGAVAMMLKSYGPLWFAGKHPSGHVVVITGISPEGIRLNDPWPPGQGTIRTISFGRFGEINVPLPYCGDGSFVSSLKCILGLQPADLSRNILHFP